MKRLFIIVGLVIATGVVVSLFLPPRQYARSSISKCYENLQDLQEAKRRWKIGNNKAATDTPTWNDIRDYLVPYTNLPSWTNGRPVCPLGGTYKLGRVGDPATCSIGGPGHSLNDIGGFKQDK